MFWIRTQELFIARLQAFYFGLKPSWPVKAPSFLNDKTGPKLDRLLCTEDAIDVMDDMDFMIVMGAMGGCHRPPVTITLTLSPHMPLPTSRRKKVCSVSSGISGQKMTSGQAQSLV